MAPRSVLVAAASILVLASAVIAAQQAQARPGSEQSAAQSAAGAQVPAFAPDLFVESIEFKNYKLETLPDGSRRGSFQPKYTIKNGGSAKSGEFRFTWEYWDKGTGTWAFWLYPPPLTCDNLAAGSSISRGGQLADEFGFTVPAGTNSWPKFRVKIDTLNQVAERNEQNNEKTREATPISAGIKPVTPVIPKLN